MVKDNRLFVCFDELDDPRTQKHSSRHSLIDILTDLRENSAANLHLSE